VEAKDTDGIPTESPQNLNPIPSRNDTFIIGVEENRDLAPTLGNAIVPAAMNLVPTFGNRIPVDQCLAPTLGNMACVPWTIPAGMIAAEALDFDYRAADGRRPARTLGEGVTTFELSDQRRPTHLMRWVIAFVAREWGYCHAGVSRKNKRAIAAAAC
jgi:hypothetical protein